MVYYWVVFYGIGELLMKIKKLTATCAILSGLLLGGATTAVVPATASAASNKDQVTIYLTRHGETTANVMQRVQGSSDFPLTKNGVTVANDLGYGLKGIKFKHAYTGNLPVKKRRPNMLLTILAIRELRLPPRLSCGKVATVVSRVIASRRTTRRLRMSMAIQMDSNSSNKLARTTGTNYRMPTTSWTLRIHKTLS